MNRMAVALTLSWLMPGLVWAAGNAGGWQTTFGQYPESRLQAIAPYGEGFVGIADAFSAVAPNGDQVFHTLAFWNNGVWTTTGEDPDGVVGAVSTEFMDIVQFGQDICVGGDFVGLGPEEFSKLACWSVTAERWYQPVGPGLGPNFAVSTLAWDGASRLYVGGDFTAVKDAQGNDILVNKVVATDGFTWEPLVHQGSIQNGVSGPVWDIVPSLGGAYIAHHRSVSEWNPTVPEMKVFGSANNSIWTLEFFFSDLVAGGPFSVMDGVQAAQIAATAAGSKEGWAPYGDGLLGPGSGGFAVLGQGFGFLYASGAWKDLPGDSQLARWTGVVWEPVDLQTGLFSPVREIETLGPDNRVCIKLNGGSSGELAVANVACQETPNGPWRGVSQGLGDVFDISDSANVLKRFQGDIYAGGRFNSAGDSRRGAGIARWDGARWQPLGLGLNDGDGTAEVKALATYGGSLYVGGFFNQAGESSTQNLARWDGNQWHSIGGLNFGDVTGLKRHDNKLYIVMRSFGAPCSSNLCVWDGSSISALGSDVNGQILSLTSFEGELIAGGIFSNAGGAFAKSLAAWDGVSWSEFEGGVNPPPGIGGGAAQVSHLAVLGGDLYIASNTSGGTVGPGLLPYEGVARWNGSEWMAVGENLAYVTALEAYQGELYAAGDVTLPNGTVTKTVARWNGSSWQALARGLKDGAVSGMSEVSARDIQFGNDGLMYLAGGFTVAGNVWSTNIAALDVDTFMATGFE